MEKEEAAQKIKDIVDFTGKSLLKNLAPSKSASTVKGMARVSK